MSFRCCAAVIPREREQRSTREDAVSHGELFLLLVGVVLVLLELAARWADVLFDMRSVVP